MVPEGLVLLLTVAFAVSVVRLGRRNVLVQELPAVETLARIDVLCFDKTGTITTWDLTVGELVRLGGAREDGSEDVKAALGAVARADPAPNATMRAISTEWAPPDGWTVSDRVPFSSARKWSAATFDGHGTWLLGAPEVLLGASTGASAPQSAALNETDILRRAEIYATAGRRVVLLAAAKGTVSDHEVPALTPAALVVLDERVRDDAAAALLLALAVGVARVPFPFLPRHLTLIGSLTIGIPAFFLALEPNTRRARPGFVPRVLRVATPAGIVAATGTLVAYGLAREVLDVPPDEARTTATLTLAGIGLVLLALVASPLNRLRIAGIGVLAGAFVGILAIPWSREFFAVAVPSAQMFAVIGGVVLVAGGSIVCSSAD
jgi:magnesium-transporting ATPase (P-type)